MNERQMGNKEATKLDLRMAKLAEALNVEAREQKQLYEQILRLEDRLKIVLSPIEPHCDGTQSTAPLEKTPVPKDDGSPLIISLDDFGRTILSNIKEVKRLGDRLSEIIKRLEI